MKFIFAVLLIGQSVLALECPKAPGEDSLTFSQAMRNFGRALRPAEMTILKGKEHPESITDQELEQALAGVAMAVACAEESLRLCEVLLAPPKIAAYSATQKAAYLEKSTQHMEGFLSGLKKFHSLFEEMLKTPQVNRDFRALNQQNAVLMDSARRAHSEL